MPCFFTKGATSLAPFSSNEIPTTSNPCGPYFFWNSINQGISTMHGAHQVAQKFTSTTLSLKSAMWTLAPSRLVNSKLAAGLHLNAGTDGGTSTATSATVGLA